MENTKKTNWFLIILILIVLVVVLLFIIRKNKAPIYNESDEVQNAILEELIKTNAQNSIKITPEQEESIIQELSKQQNQSTNITPERQEEIIRELNNTNN